MSYFGKKNSSSNEHDDFQSLKDNISSFDPVWWCEKHLNIDGKPFTLSGSGFKPFSDIYRYIGVRALQRNSKPIILVKGRQVGGTVMLGALECYFGASGLFGKHNKPPIRVLHCFPDQNKSLAYSKTKLTSLISSSKDDNKNIKKGDGEKLSFIQRKIDKSAPTNDSANFKRFENDNQIFIEYIGLDGDRLRSRTVDVLFYDEVQDMRQNAILAVNKCASQAQYGPLLKGVQCFIGTPKQKGSNYWHMWQSSSQQYFHLGCEDCGRYFALYTPGTDDWEEVWISGFIVKCRHCGHEQDKRKAADRGKWISLGGDDHNNHAMVGYHVNQLLYPTFTKEAILAEKNNPITTEKMFRNEVLGEFFAGDASPLTPDIIYEYAADHDRAISLSGAEFADKNVFLGCDWGRKLDLSQYGDNENVNKKVGQSYSCAVALVPDGVNLNIVYATRFKKNNLEYRVSLVQEIYRQFRITLGVGDIGDGHEVVEALQSEYYDRFLASMAAGHLTNAKAVYRNEYSPHTIVFERNYYIEELINLIKKGRIRFPYKKEGWERIAWLVEHCCSMEIKPTKKQTGEIVINYVKGSTPNDGFMALLNAYLAYKFHLTQGFTIKDPKRLEDRMGKKKEGIPAVLAHVPRNARMMGGKH